MVRRAKRRRREDKRTEQGGSPRLRWRRRWPMLAAAGACAAALGVWAAGREAPPVIYDYEVVRVYPHDPEAYCQGLAFADGVLYEGTGEYGASSLRKVELASGKVLQRVDLDSRYFGEGIAVWKEQIHQLTWRNQIGIVYDKQSLAELKRFRYTGQGWGLTHDGRHLIMSDGSPTLQFLDPQTFRVVRRLTVQSQGQRIRDLNELEFVEGQILANVWHKDQIACISPRTGYVTAWIDLTGLLPRSERRDQESVLNGIAYDAAAKRLFVTGKNWPKLFEIRLKPR